jgi:DsbC/DsbD-like thiol-disulfide interchange protein
MHLELRFEWRSAQCVVTSTRTRRAGLHCLRPGFRGTDGSMNAARFLVAALMMSGAWAACVPVVPVRAQETGQRVDPVRWMLTASAAEGSPVRKGAAVTVRLHAAIEPGWHIYSLHEGPGGATAMRITVPPLEPFAISGDLDAPLPKSAIDPGFEMETHFYTGNVEMTIPLRATRKTAGPVAIDVSYQACTRETCLPPTVAHLTARLEQGQEEQP